MIGLLPQSCSQGINLPFLQGNPCRLFFSSDLQLLDDMMRLGQLGPRERRPRYADAELAVCSYDNRGTDDWYTDRSLATYTHWASCR